MNNKYINELTFDLPIQYKELKLYPVLVKDFLTFSYYSNCLTLDKNREPDVRVITMSYLEYIYRSALEGGTQEKLSYIIMLDRLLAMVLKDEQSFSSAQVSINRYSLIDDKPFFEIGNVQYNSTDFLKIREIIAEQNLVELPDDNISKEVTDAMEEARRIKNRVTGNNPGTFEDYIVSLSVATGWKPEYIHNMTIRRFVHSVRRMNNLIHYKIYLGASMSGFVEFKDKSFIKHWLNNLEETDKFSDVSMDLEEVKDKISPPR